MLRSKQLAMMSARMNFWKPTELTKRSRGDAVRNVDGGAEPKGLLAAASNTVWDGRRKATAAASLDAVAAAACAERGAGRYCLPHKRTSSASGFFLFLLLG